MGMGLFLFRDIPEVGVNDDSVSNLKDSAEALFFFLLLMWFFLFSRPLLKIPVRKF